MKSPDLSIVIVGMNHIAYLKELLPSIGINYPPPFANRGIDVQTEIIYVDNCSTDGSVEYIEEHYPEVKILKNKTPLGFGENNNRGVLASTGAYIAIINPDIVALPGSLRLLYEYAKQHPECGVVVPQLLNPDHTLQYSVRSFVTPHTLFSRALSKGKDNTDNEEVNRYLCKEIDFEKIQTVDWAIGAAFLLSRDWYAELGGFDTDYFLYMEDEDLCLRSWKANRPVVYCPQSKMIHNHQRASSKIGKKMFIHLKSLFTFFRKHGMGKHHFNQLPPD